MKFLTEKGIRVIALLMILILSVAVWVENKSPYAVQMRNMAISRVYVDAVKPSLEEKPHFKNASIDVSTANNGAILVHGMVSNEQIESELIGFLRQRNPPRPLIVRLRIAEPLDDPDGGINSESLRSSP
jgi:hypothetical protein